MNNLKVNMHLIALIFLLVVIALLGVKVQEFKKISCENKNLISVFEQEQKRALELEKKNKELQTEVESLKNEADKINSDLIEQRTYDVKKDVINKDEKVKSIVNTDVVYDKNNLTKKSSATSKDLKQIIQNTGLKGLEESYIQAENTYGVNAIFLLALTAEESGWGNSNRARNQNNISGFEVYNNGSKGAYFDSKHESLMTTARLLKNEYLSPTGTYYSGLNIYSVNKKYCPVGGNSWSNNINSIANQIVKKINRD